MKNIWLKHLKRRVPVLRGLERRRHFIFTELPHGQRAESLVGTVCTNHLHHSFTVSIHDLNYTAHEYKEKPHDHNVLYKLSPLPKMIFAF